MQTNIPSFDQRDVDQNKVVAGLSYILFFLPFLACPNSKFARFHANQAFLNFLLGIALWIVGLIPFIGPVISWIGGIALFAFSVIGLVNGFQGQAKRMPLYGQFDIFK